MMMMMSSLVNIKNKLSLCKLFLPTTTFLPEIIEVYGYDYIERKSLLASQEQECIK